MKAVLRYVLTIILALLILALLILVVQNILGKTTPSLKNIQKTVNVRLLVEQCNFENVFASQNPCCACLVDPLSLQCPYPDNSCRDYVYGGVIKRGCNYVKDQCSKNPSLCNDFCNYYPDICKICGVK